jgi:tryptophan synthase beta chain
VLDLEADTIIACVGGGSNFAGFSFPFIADKMSGKNEGLEVIACEASACPSLSKGLFAYDYGDSAQMAPIVKMYTLGHKFIPSPIHAGGLRYHGSAPAISILLNNGLMDAVSFTQNQAFEAVTLFARKEGFLFAPETAHAVKATIDVALECKKTGEEKTIIFNASGHGHFDLAAYDAYRTQNLVDYHYPVEQIKKSQEVLPKISQT